MTHDVFDSEMNRMYEEFLGHFRLERNPFAISLSPQIFYSTAAHDEALLQLVFGTETRQGLMVLTGEPGTGKTMILHYFREWLRQRCNYSTAYLSHTSLPSMDLLRHILKDFGISNDTPSKGDLLIALTDWLTERHRARDCPVVLIDEAQALTNTALEELRMLLNLEVDHVKLVQIVLAGQPLLEQKLRLPQMTQLRQRMMCHFQLPPFTPEETAGYIVRRLAWAGSEDPGLFPPETVREIFKYSKGIPRVINLICEHALLSCFVDKRNSVGLNDVVAVAQDFELGGETRNGMGLSRTNIFCRLIPFPELSVEDVEVKSKQGVEQTATTATMILIEQKKETSTLPVVKDFAAVDPICVPSAGVSASRLGSVISKIKLVASKLCSQFLSYRHAVVSSFVRDGSHFVKQCMEWLSKPMEIGGVETATLHRMVRSLRSWLLEPMSSTTILLHRRRESSTRLKDFRHTRLACPTVLRCASTFDSLLRCARKRNHLRDPSRHIHLREKDDASKKPKRSFPYVAQ